MKTFNYKKAIREMENIPCYGNMGKVYLAHFINESVKIINNNIKEVKLPQYNKNNKFTVELLKSIAYKIWESKSKINNDKYTEIMKELSELMK